jgi:hypothetical protein
MVSVHSSPLLDGDLGLQLGGGGAIPIGPDAPVTAPRFRFILSVRYAPLGRPKKPKPAPPPETETPKAPEAPVDMTDRQPAQPQPPPTEPPTPPPSQ